MSAYPAETVIAYKCDVGYVTETPGMLTCKRPSDSDKALWVGPLPLCSILTTTVKIGDGSDDSEDNNTLFRIGEYLL